MRACLGTSRFARGTLRIAFACTCCNVRVYLRYSHYLPLFVLFPPLSRKFCTTACVSGIAALSQMWRDMDVRSGACDFQIDGVSDYGERRALHERLQQEQYECSPPKAVCTSLYNDHLFWLSSGTSRVHAGPLKPPTHLHNLRRLDVYSSRRYM